MDLNYLSCFSLVKLLLYSHRAVMQKLADVCGIFGMVTPREKTCLLHPVVGRFTTGDTIRVVLPAEVVRQLPWQLEGNKSCELRITFDVPEGETVVTFTVRVCWCTTVFRDEVGYVEKHFTY
jgi:hypothetical protein